MVGHYPNTRFIVPFSKALRIQLLLSPRFSFFLALLEPLRFSTMSRLVYAPAELLSVASARILQFFLFSVYLQSMTLFTSCLLDQRASSDGSRLVSLALSSVSCSSCWVTSSRLRSGGSSEGHGQASKLVAMGKKKRLNLLPES